MTNMKFLDSSGFRPLDTVSIATPLFGPYGIMGSLDSVEQPAGGITEFAHYTVTMGNSIPLSSAGTPQEVGAGIARDPEIAKGQAIGEAIERYCLSIYDTTALARAPYRETDKHRETPERFNKFREALPEAEYYWEQVIEYTTGEEVEIPAQLVYFPFTPLETTIRNPITTGAAAHTSYNGATKAALQEVVERDAYIISYLNELPNPKIPDERIKQAGAEDVVNTYREHDFDPVLVYLTLDIPVHVVLCILRDTRLGNVELGLAADFDLDAAIQDALFESYHAHTWLQDLDVPDTPSEVIINSIEERAQYWLAKTDLEGLTHWISSENTLTDPVESVDSAKELLAWFEKKQMPVYIADIGTADVQQHGFQAVRAVIPDLHPMHLVEDYRYLGGDRVVVAPVAAGFHETPKQKTELNPIPHPFL